MVNPVKIWVLAANLLSQLLKIFPTAWLENTIEDLCKLCNTTIDETPLFTEVESMLNDRCYNGLCVIDIIGNIKLDAVIANAKVTRFIGNVWSGPFKLEGFTKQSTSTQIMADFAR